MQHLLALIQVKFPERVLTFKIEGGSSSERDKWVEALEQAKQNNQEEHRRKGSADKLKQLRKVCCCGFGRCGRWPS